MVTSKDAILGIISERDIARALSEYGAPVVSMQVRDIAKPMRFTRLIPAIGAIPELYSYYCDSCGEAVTEVGVPGKRRDPLRYLDIDRASSRPN